MANESLIKRLQILAQELGRPPTRADAAVRGISEWELRKLGGLQEALKLAGFSPPEKREKPEPGSSAELSVKLRKAQAELERLRKLQAETEAMASSSEKLREMILGTERDYAPDTDWLKGARQGKGTRGIANLILSDLHFDEVVNKAQMGGVNEYNRELAVRRIRQVFKGFVETFKYHLVTPKFDGCILHLLGDLLSGNIHEELAETNEAVITQSILMLEEILIDGIEGLAEEFGKVHIPCIVGNHGRIHKKPRAKNYAWENYEWLIYMHLQRHFRNDPRVSIEVADGLDLLIPVYERFYLDQHGQEFKGGNGIGGIMIPILRGLAKKQSALAAVNRRFHVALMGHFHQRIHTSNLVINGTTKGWDEWTKSMGFAFEKPQQAGWIEHRERGMILCTPIFCDA